MIICINFVRPDRLPVGKCVADGPGGAGGAALAGGHLAGVQEPEQEARRLVSFVRFVCLPQITLPLSYF